MTEKNRKKVLLGLIALILLLSLGIVTFAFLRKGEENKAQAEYPVLSDEPLAIYTHKVEEKNEVKVTTGKIIEEDLRNIGVLVTEEYCFTEVIDHTTTRQLFFKLYGANSQFVFSYEGTISAGIDFEGITIAKSDERKVITVHLPKAELFSTEIDHDSFKSYLEKESIFNKISSSDYNDAMKELVENAKTRALERGILDRATENAKNLITQFIRGIGDTADYTITFV